MDDSTILIIGAGGQVGRALHKLYPNAQADKLDITDRQALQNFNWTGIKTILNAAAYTDVDKAETNTGRIEAWRTNSSAILNLLSIIQEKGITLVHFSSDYVFDGTKVPHQEDEPFSPLGVYGQTKAAGDLIVSSLPAHYILRTSWIIGEGGNFVRTMLEFGKKGVEPEVVSDQTGRPTFAADLARAADHLLKNKPPFGTYNFSNGGDPVSWAEIARETFTAAGFKQPVKDISSADYFSHHKSAPRPLNSTLDLSKIQSTGLVLNDWRPALRAYVKRDLSK